MTSAATVLRPQDLGEVQAALRDTTGPLQIAGAGTAATWAGLLAPVDAVLDTTALTGVITHNPGDMTVAVRAGTPLAALHDELAEHAQHVSLDAARIAEGATVGGLLATGDAGPAALVFGSLRDVVIGVTLVLADGTVARAGGHVIKNVAGYDMAKVVHGSYGTLAVVAEVVLRLHPVPKAAVTVQLPCSLAEAAEVAARVLGGPTEPAALEWTSDDVLLLRIEGTAAALERAPRGCGSCSGRRGRRRRAARAARRADRAAAGTGATRGPGTPLSPGATRPPPWCGSACGLQGCPRCSPRCPRWRPPRGWAPASRRSRCPRAPSPTSTRACTPRAAPPCCAPVRPGRTCPPGGRRPRRSACCAPSNTPSTPTTASDPAASTPGCDPVPGAFDTHRPPSRELLDDCVHCGFCLPTCPTYQLWGEEMDSPRGRIYLMSLAERGEIGLEGPFATHIDRCLGCMACVTACPSGVQYDRLLEATRPQVERAVERDKDDKLFRDAIFALFPYKRRLRAAAVPGGLYQALRKIPAIRALAERLPGRLAAMESLLPPVSVRDAFARLPVHTPAVGTRRGRVALLTGCVQDVFFHRVNAATVRVLAAEGWDVLVPRDQQCCGALEFHSGREEPALARARREIGVYSDLDVDYVVTNVAGCGSSMKEYGHLLDDDAEWAERAKAFSARVRDVHEVLAEGEPRATRHPVRARVAYHDACHLGHAQKVRAQPRAVLRSIPGVELLDLPEAELCCGSAGIYNMVAPEAAGELGARKAENIAATRPDIVVTANPGCLLQIGKHLGVDVPLLHPVQLLDASIRGVPVPRT